MQPEISKLTPALKGRPAATDKASGFLKDRRLNTRTTGPQVKKVMVAHEDRE